MFVCQEREPEMGHRVLPIVPQNDGISSRPRICKFIVVSIFFLAVVTCPNVSSVFSFKRKLQSMWGHTIICKRAYVVVNANSVSCGDRFGAGASLFDHTWWWWCLCWQQEKSEVRHYWWSQSGLWLYWHAAFAYQMRTSTRFSKQSSHYQQLPKACCLVVEYLTCLELNRQH